MAVVRGLNISGQESFVGRAQIILTLLFSEPDVPVSFIFTN